MLIQKGGEVSTMELFQSSAGKGILIGFPLLSFAFIAFQPAALQLYFLTTGAWAFAQAHVVNNTTFRKTMGLTISDAKLRKKDDSNMKLLEKKSKSLAALHERLAYEQRYAAEMRKPKPQSHAGQADQNLSSIDRWVNKGKKAFEDFTADAGEKMRSFSGQSTKNADGSDPEPPSITDEERQRAEDYEAEMKAMDAYNREERNAARRRDHLRAVKEERRKAVIAEQTRKAAAKQQKQRK